MSDSKDTILNIKLIKENLEKLILKKELESTYGEVMKILEKLDSVNINREILKQTKIGVVMTAVKKGFCEVNNIAIVTKADELIRKWKEALATNTQQTSNKDEKLNDQDKSSTTKKLRKSDEENSTEENVDNQSQVKSEFKERIEEEGSLHKEYIGPLTGDVMRDKARNFLWKAMVTGVPYSQAKLMKESQVCEIAAEIESVLHREYIVKGENSVRDYNLQLKTIKWNLSDLKNPELNSKLYVGKITPEEIARMQSREMASDAKQKEREKHKQESLEACQSDWDLRNLIQKEGQFTCGKCKTNKTTYYQMQTRSADEPMTTFVRCLNCGNRWKF
ncbi:transcription elongation factor TFIIS [Cryptosporidium ubiquitum]|uniref:Transcription elongation factor TFIIS n=1 Tax=Cryptosporidium ubiquitum TaxID=857276 RepID=A0A1J4MH60_9CRYT|nr:transcription elongation factor TFIIS [Cryptosporidium ubiquitum]OII72795.1 transcription elongation factor TFIIS [Cryptosporidium ubiquitum]